MTTREEIAASIRKVIRDCFPEESFGELTEESVINNETNIDSMGFVLIICKLEAMFDVKIPEEEWPKLLTLGDVVTAIQSRLPQET